MNCAVVPQSFLLLREVFSVIPAQAGIQKDSSIGKRWILEPVIPAQAGIGATPCSSFGRNGIVGIMEWDNRRSFRLNSIGKAQSLLRNAAHEK